MAALFSYISIRANGNSECKCFLVRPASEQSLMQSCTLTWGHIYHLKRPTRWRQKPLLAWTR